MKKLNTVIKNELFRYFTSPLAYVYLVSFLLLNSSFAFYFGDFFSKGQSNLYSMFAFQPWLYLIFIPGIAMRLWAEEFRTKTIIQIVTTPISITTLVWGKFFAAWIFCGIALALTFPFWITVNSLGQPDNLVIFVAYLASFLLAGCILSISATMSALTKNQVIALVLSVFASILFFLSGLDFVLSLFRAFAPASIVDMIASFSFLTHFDTMARGLIELRDIVFFASIIILFNFLTILIVSFKTSGTSKLFKSNSSKYAFVSVFFFLIGFVGLNLIANNLLRNIQYDATEEKLFTLSPSTIKTLEDLPRKVIVKLYYSPVLGERNHQIRLMFDRTRILLNKYVAHSGGKIDYKIYNPKFLDRIEDEALNNNLQPIPVIDINQNGYFGMSFTDELDSKTSIPFFAQERENFIEQDITQKIYELYHKKKTVGILTTLQMGNTSIDGSSVSTQWAITDKIRELYNLKFVDKPEEISDLDILMIVHPQKIPENIVDAIKAFSMKGGKFFIALDGATEATRIYSMAPGEYSPSNLSGLDQFWGFKTYTDWVIADLDNSIMVDATDNYQTNPKFTQDIIQLKYGNDSFNPKLPEVASLQSLMFASASPIIPTSDEIVFIPLIKAGENSQLMPMKIIYDNVSPNQILNYFEKDENTKILAARILGETIENPFELIVVGDTDFLYDTFWGKTTSILNQQFIIPILDNANFVMNVLDTLSDDTNLIELRGRTAKFRKFENVEKTRRLSQQEFAIKESEILEKISQTKLELDEITNKRNFEQREEFNADELAVLTGIRKKLDNLRQELSETRLNSSKKIEKIEMTLKVLNIYSVPALIIFFFLVRKLFSRKRNKEKSQKLVFSKESKKIVLASLTLIFIGILSTYLTDKREIDRYENKFIFENLKNEINEIEKFSIKTHQEELVFYKENNVWKLKGYEDFPVYQERIKNLFVSLMDARYYEKKTDKAEYLSIFGLSPVEEENSMNTRIELYGQNDEKLFGLEVGKHDIEIGRGAKAAYIKFDNKFQVWLASVEFIDLSTNWQNWTYSTVWNLRFGRLKTSGKNTEETQKKELLLARDLLNIKFNGKTISAEKQRIGEVIKFANEEDDQIALNIFKKAEKYFVEYKISTPIKNELLAFFYKTAQGKIYELSREDKEKIENVISIAR